MTIAIYKAPVIDLVGQTVMVDGFRSPEFPSQWEDDPDSPSESLIELAGRGCYQSWHKPNPATATNEGYIEHILEVGHGSVLEHVSITFYIQGISRSLTHELVRHRHFGFSQLSQRFVDESEFGFVVPPLLVDDEDAIEDLVRAASAAQGNYQDTLTRAQLAAAEAGLKGFPARKAAREAARAVLPNMAETKLTVTGNLRAWRHFLSIRGAEGADAEIKRLAAHLVPFLVAAAPNTFQDLHVHDGTVSLEHGSV